LEAFCALAKNAIAPPACKDTADPGLMVIFAGNGEAPAGVCPPHPLRVNKEPILNRESTATAIPTPERNLPMHSSLRGRSLFDGRINLASQTRPR
jgi:hypothetical protein